jgi:DNA-binding PadR family transcriptional regulator
MPAKRSALDFLPLKPPVFQVLLTLRAGPRHGYAIMQDVAEESAGVITILPGALYRDLDRLVTDGIVEEVPAPKPERDQDSRRRYYRLTTLGVAVAEAEARRLAQVVASARRLDLLGPWPA